MRTREIEAMLKRKEPLTQEEKEMVAKAIIKNKNTRKVAQNEALRQNNIPLFIHLGGFQK